MSKRVGLLIKMKSWEISEEVKGRTKLKRSVDNYKKKDCGYGDANDVTKILHLRF